ncbi:oxidoreductase [Streptomyces sp. NPDC093085]|uniref:oxidoreductase n=1 Tax=Streptomyces sp. NPDC093085 TaxID=3155068 RepID=UPI00342F76BA
MTEPQYDEYPDWLSAAEVGMWQSFRNGSTYDLSTSDPLRNDPFSPRPWPMDRSVRARVIALLLLSGPPALPGRVAALKLRGAQITGTLNLAGGTVAPYVELTRCRFENEVVLPESHFTTLRMVGCALPRLEAARLRTQGDLHLPRCRVERGIRLTDAQIGTDLLISQIDVGPDRTGRAIAADGMSVAQDFTADQIETYGEVSLRGAKVGVSLSLRGSRLRAAEERRALNAPQLTVERSLYLAGAWINDAADPLATLGAPDIPAVTPPYGIPLGAALGSLPGSSSGPAAAPALSSTRLQRFECRGGVRLDDGRFGDALDVDGARFFLAPTEELSLRRITTPELRFKCERVEEGRVVLSGARIVTLIDMSTSWPGPGGIAMGGFVYENLVPFGHFPLLRRLEWLAAATPEYSPEPYERLAQVLRNSGEDADAREVLLAKQRRRRETLPLAAKVWGYLQDWTVAYGYRPGRAALWMALLWGAGTIAFARNPPAPLRPDEHPAWNPALYALDLLVPVIDLGQDGYWLPEGTWQWTAAGLVVLGWILATTVATGATRVLRRG